jgi:hypothetical protein
VAPGSAGRSTGCTGSRRATRRARSRAGSARAAHRRLAPLGAPRAHAEPPHEIDPLWEEPPHEIDLLWETLRALQRPRGARTVCEVVKVIRTWPGGRRGHPRPARTGGGHPSRLDPSVIATPGVYAGGLGAGRGGVRAPPSSASARAPRPRCDSTTSSRRRSARYGARPWPRPVSPRQLACDAARRPPHVATLHGGGAEECHEGKLHRD